MAEIRHYLDRDGGQDESLRIPDRVLTKWGRLFDIVLPTSQRTCCFTRGGFICRNLKILNVEYTIIIPGQGILS